MLGEPQFLYVRPGSHPPPTQGAGYWADPLPAADGLPGPASHFEGSILFDNSAGTASQVPHRYLHKPPTLVAHPPHQRYATQGHVGYELPHDVHADIAAGHHGAVASVSLGPEPQTNEQHFPQFEEPIHLEMDDTSDYQAELPPPSAPHCQPAEHSGPSNEDGLWDPEWSIAIFTVGCCLPPVLLYNFLFCHSSSTTARIMARLSQMMLIFYAVIFVMVMAVVTATDSW